MEPEERVLDMSGREIAGGPAESDGVQSMLGLLSEIQTLVERSNIINVSIDAVIFLLKTMLLFKTLTTNCCTFVHCAHLNNKKTKMVCFVFY